MKKLKLSSIKVNSFVTNNPYLNLKTFIGGLAKTDGTTEYTVCLTQCECSGATTTAVSAGSTNKTTNQV